jgi:hypothetical protein
MLFSSSKQEKMFVIVESRKKDTLHDDRDEDCECCKRVADNEDGKYMNQREMTIKEIEDEFKLKYAKYDMVLGAGVAKDIATAKEMLLKATIANRIYYKYSAYPVRDVTTPMGERFRWEIGDDNHDRALDGDEIYKHYMAKKSLPLCVERQALAAAEQELKERKWRLDRELSSVKDARVEVKEAEKKIAGLQASIERMKKAGACEEQGEN